jgi:hypothetical protein
VVGRVGLKLLTTPHRAARPFPVSGTRRRAGRSSRVIALITQGHERVKVLVPRGRRGSVFP